MKESLLDWVTPNYWIAPNIPRCQNIWNWYGFESDASDVLITFSTKTPQKMPTPDRQDTCVRFKIEHDFAMNWIFFPFWRMTLTPNRLFVNFRKPMNGWMVSEIVSLLKYNKYENELHRLNSIDWNCPMFFCSFLKKTDFCLFNLYCAVVFKPFAFQCDRLNDITFCNKTTIMIQQPSWWLAAIRFYLVWCVCAFQPFIFYFKYIHFRSKLKENK